MILIFFLLKKRTHCIEYSKNKMILNWILNIKKNNWNKLLTELASVKLNFQNFK